MNKILDVDSFVSKTRFSSDILFIYLLWRPFLFKKMMMMVIAVHANLA